MILLDNLLAVLPPDRPVCDIRIGLHWTLVVLEPETPSQPARAALTTTIPLKHGHAHQHERVEQAGDLHTMSAHQLARMAYSEVGPERSVGWASINALLGVDPNRCVELNAREFLVEKGKDKRVVIVGHFPFVQKVRDVADSLWSLELDPGPEDLPASAAPEVIPQADVVAVTSLTLINNTFEDLAALWRPDALVMMLGPSTPFTPLLFEHGVDVLSGALVIAPEETAHSVSEAASFQQMRGVQLLTTTRESWGS